MKKAVFFIVVVSVFLFGKKACKKENTDDGGTEYVTPVDDENAAEINFQQPSQSEVSERTLVVTACIKSKSRVEAVNITINGQVARAISVVKNDGCDHSVNQRIILDEGNNTIQISVKNGAGWVSAERKVVYRSAPVAAKSKRYALVIGNAAYSNNTLRNPVNDATDVAKKLGNLNFEVTLLSDQNRREMIDAINGLSAKKEYEAVMFYYAGHGIQSNDKSYLIPLDAKIAQESDLEHEGVDVARVLAKLEDSGCNTKIIVLDACRNNPLERSWRRGDNDKGLSAMSAPSGTIIAYATAPNNVADDGTGRNSPFTHAFLNALDEKHHIGVFFIRVTREVKLQTGGRQEPWTQSSLDGDFYFNQL